jgi:hypothetical protein
MNTLVKYDNKKQEDILINNGKKIIETNEFLKDLSNLMENEEFKTFYNKHMTTWIDIKCTSIYMRLYSEFKIKYKKISNVELDKHVVVFLLRKIMTDKKLRPFSIQTIDKMQEGKWESNEFWREFETYMLINHKQLGIVDKE